MENFNKNWLVIILLVVVFFILGFLVGRVTGHHHGKHQQPKERMMMRHGAGNKVMRLGDDGEVTIKVDTLAKDGQKLEVTVEKKTKK